MLANEVVLGIMGPVAVSRPQPARELPLLFDSPHSGHWYPSDFQFAVSAAQLRRTEDAHVDRLFGMASAHGASLIAARFPRAYVDCNRRRDDIDVDLLASPWPSDHPLQPAPSAKSKLGKGLVWRLLDDGTPIYRRALGPQEIERRIMHFYDPYRTELARKAEELHERFGAYWHVNCHSMPSVAEAFATEQPGLAHADIVVGDRDGTTAAEPFVALIEHHFAARGYSVARNHPYKGADIVASLGRPERGTHSVQLELNRKLYMDESTLEVHVGFERLRADIDALIQKLCGYVAGSLGRAAPAPLPAWLA